MRGRITQVIAMLCVCVWLGGVACSLEKETAGETVQDLQNLPDFPDCVADLLAYETCTDGQEAYVRLTGIKEEYRTDFAKYLAMVSGTYSYPRQFSIPEEINGIRVEEIAADAFREIAVEVAHLPEHLRIAGDRAFLHTKLSTEELTFSGEMEQIGEEAFADCGITRVTFDGGQNPSIGKRAFADNESLWAVYLPKADCDIGEEAFAGCEEVFYIGCKERLTDGKSPVEEYAAANGLTALWVPVVDSLEPVVRYPQTPYVLEPVIGTFFYGENGEGDMCLSGEEADDAPDYGFQAWHAPCGEWCVGENYLEITASSELSSADGRYAAGNLYALSGRAQAWAEGVAGNGIGESITYHDRNRWQVSNRWEYLAYEEWYRKNHNICNPLDGYIRYTEICIVNGYARDQKTWEENGRVKELFMYVEDKPYARLELEDTIRPQYFTLPWEDIMVGDGGDITFRFVIEDVYPGKVYEDTCLTGLVVEFTGRRGH
ncbi:MAG: leucine-rich repeat domain-containing protein [Lachnospiraceae bacterium]|nr:leucine-rich repeat domain-containing protein [Lachnospiraceae bacterium]